MERIHGARIFAIILVLACVLPVAAKVEVDYDRDVDFSGIKTYAWMTGTEAENPLYHKRIVAAIDQHMAEKGMQLVEGDADIYILYHASLSTERVVDIDDFGYWGRGRWGGMGSTTVDVYDIQIGTLIVDILAGADRDLAWRGMGDDSFTSNAKKNEKKINKIVGKMFREFPPE